MAALALSAGLATQSVAQVYTLSDLNSRATIDLSGQSGRYGMTDWSIAMPNQTWQSQLHQQWFWYRIGTTGDEAGINAISAPTVSWNPLSPRSISLAYSTATFGVEINYLLTGGSFGSGASDILETIRLRNYGNTPLDMHFFQYSDFNLAGTPNDERVELGLNLRGLFNEATQSQPGAPGQGGLTETVTTPGANHGEANYFGTATSTLARFQDGLPTTLSGNMSTTGNQNVTWALQWDLTIQPGASLVISKDKNLLVAVVPEPSSFALLSLGLAALAFRKRRQ